MIKRGAHIRLCIELYIFITTNVKKSLCQTRKVRIFHNKLYFQDLGPDVPGRDGVRVQDGHRYPQPVQGI